ncbi:hypothetical protein R83H12_00760 [Fibrobacteria bacterium R8-3-H12]
MNMPDVETPNPAKNITSEHSDTFHRICRIPILTHKMEVTNEKQTL